MRQDVSQEGNLPLEQLTLFGFEEESSSPDSIKEGFQPLQHLFKVVSSYADIIQGYWTCVLFDGWMVAGVYPEFHPWTSTKCEVVWCKYIVVSANEFFYFYLLFWWQGSGFDHGI
ncbi:uncharacterized protein LOC117644982 isoform X2 [Thrips palmi]|uniref:Uncharacterized protein LOC117644982 isoform X2 n=1 Tax=Thrips palmi TaxID=161013 RepID=A0A6P8Z2C4_THRPL|nr:uncharacterized protein LOC117644982 isoform X2 [Thrips palmi]